MKDRIAFWGADETDAKIFVIVRLRLEDDLFDIWTLPQASVSDEFEKTAQENIDQIDLEQLPEPHTHIERKVMEENLLPENIKTHDTQLVNLAESEWRVRVLSNKLSQQLEKMIDELFAQVKSLTQYDNEVWDLTKTFWDKVNNHYQEKDLTREHARVLRDKINEAFNILKSLRKTANEQFSKEAQLAYEKISEQVQKIINTFSPKDNLNALFDKLKRLQSEANRARLASDMRKNLYELFNNAFEMVKSERQKSGLRHLENRIRGLQDVIARMEKGIQEDKNEMSFQRNRLQHTSGQLEAQLREAKMNMLATRLESKEAKLADMIKTLEELNKQLIQEQKRYKASTQPKEKQQDKKQKNKEKPQDRNKGKAKKETTDTNPEEEATDTPKVVVTTPEKAATGVELQNQEPNAETETIVTEAEDIKEQAPEAEQETPIAVVTMPEEAVTVVELQKQKPQAEPETTDVAEEIETIVTKAEDIKEQAPEAEAEQETTVMVVAPPLPENVHHFYEPIQESDMELYEAEKPITPANPEDYADGDGTYDYDKEDRLDG